MIKFIDLKADIVLFRPLRMFESLDLVEGRVPQPEKE